ncbi:putative RNA-directed DNA polymerase [Helianthus annuus]|nr:putative RNA-directed DNA polymerase [Helianthus annuus]KAJ0854134.1 putative RNA-directed DNA polymerase [Helianthus annuus]
MCHGSLLAEEHVAKEHVSLSFSIGINDNIFGYFKGQRGLRQGDPMSPYLFTLVMEVLTSTLQRAVSLDSSYRFHNKCEKQRIVSLCFADDLFLFARGDADSARVIMKSLDTFKHMSGLVPSMSKSTAFFCNVSSNVKLAIKSIIPFEEGNLPIKYLGVPLIATKLMYKDCKVLVERIDKRMSDWKTKFLSFTGRLQLISSVLSSLYTYWASVFILPMRIIKEIEKRMKGFLWCQDSLMTGKAKVS